MLRMFQIPSFLVPTVLSILVLGCQDGAARNDAGLPSLSSATVPAVDEAKIQVTQDLDRIMEIVTAKNIVADHGSNFIYIDGPSDGKYMIIQETFSSRSKYKTITPIISIEQNDLIIDCSYVRSIDDMTSVSVGTYCRGRSEASLESIEDAVSDKHLLTYSSSLPWLDEAGNAADCKNPSGLAYARYYIVRCQSGEADETTENLSITVLSSDYRVIFSSTGFEFAPSTTGTNERLLTFWGLNTNSHHEIVEKALP